MRNLLTIVALAATTMIAGNAAAQNLWSAEDGYATTITGEFDYLGVQAGGGWELHGATIGDLYIRESSKDLNEALKITGVGESSITNFYVTPETLGKGTFLNWNTSGKVSVENYTLVVGNKNGPTEQPFATTGTVDSVEITNTSLNGVTTIGDWGAAQNYIVDNAGTITNLTYGLSNDKRDNYKGAGRTVTVTNLTITNGAELNQAANYWGANPLASVGFGEGGGEITVAGNSDGTLNDVNFTTSAIDLTGATLYLDYTGEEYTGSFIDWVAAFEDGFSVDILSIFSEGTDVDGELAMINFIYGDENYSIADLTDGGYDDAYGGKWALNDDAEGFYSVSYSAEPQSTPAPEPATLAVLGLGLAGLGMVSRRRRK